MNRLSLKNDRLKFKSKEINHHSRRIYGIYSKIIKKDRKITTWDFGNTRMDLDRLCPKMSRETARFNPPSDTTNLLEANLFVRFPRIVGFDYVIEENPLNCPGARVPCIGVDALSIHERGCITR